MASTNMMAIGGKACSPTTFRKSGPRYHFRCGSTTMVGTADVSKSANSDNTPQNSICAWILARRATEISPGTTKRCTQACESTLCRNGEPSGIRALRIIRSRWERKPSRRAAETLQTMIQVLHVGQSLTVIRVYPSQQCRKPGDRYTSIETRYLLL